MARYNRWQNASLYAAADSLSDEERRKDRGAFFKSIHASLNHLLWADHMWLSRISDAPRPSTPLSEFSFVSRRLGRLETGPPRLRRTG